MKTGSGLRREQGPLTSRAWAPLADSPLRASDVKVRVKVRVGHPRKAWTSERSSRQTENRPQPPGQHPEKVLWPGRAARSPDWPPEGSGHREGTRPAGTWHASRGQGVGQGHADLRHPVALQQRVAGGPLPLLQHRQGQRSRPRNHQPARTMGTASGTGSGHEALHSSRPTVHDANGSWGLNFKSAL